MDDQPLFEGSFDEHKRAQRKRWAAETTAEQRLMWLEEALAFAHACGIDYLEQKRKRREKEDRQRAESSRNSP